jgi:deoxyribose-phosphate aldolase
MAQKVNDFDGHFPGVPNVAAMCVYPALVETAREVLTEPIGIAAVAAGFPASQTFIEVKVAEAAMAVAAGATEIDIVISIGKFLEGNYQEVYDEISEIKAAIKDAHLKVILETGALKTVENIYKASIIAMAAGADFIKTSTGKIAVNATPEATYVMCTAIKDWHTKTGKKVCYKPAGGVSTTNEAVQHYTLVKDILGKDWLNNESFRFGASRLANNLLTSILGTETKYF